VDFDRLNRWLSLAANLGLLAGLILVAVQINQNTQLARLQLINEGNVTRNQIWATALGENPALAVAKSIEKPAEMNYADYIVVDTYLFTNLNLFYRNYELAKEGIFDESDWQQMVDNFALWLIGSAFGRAWWFGSGRSFFEPEFAVYVDELLKGTAGEDSFEHWRRIRDLLSRD
jgi:hypothetical protein